MSKKEETNFYEDVVKDDLEELPSTWFEKISQRATRGTPDILCCINGNFVGIELKTEVGILDPLQQYKLTQISEAGGIGLVATPENWEATLNFLKKLAKSKKRRTH